MSTINRREVIDQAIDDAIDEMPGTLSPDDRENIATDFIDEYEDCTDDEFRAQWVDATPEDIYDPLEDWLIPDMQEEEFEFEEPRPTADDPDNIRVITVRVSWRPANATHVNGDHRRHWLWDGECPVSVTMEDGEVIIREDPFPRQVTGQTEDFFETHRADSLEDVDYGGWYYVEIEQH